MRKRGQHFLSMRMGLIPRIMGWYTKRILRGGIQRLGKGMILGHVQAVVGDRIADKGDPCILFKDLRVFHTVSYPFLKKIPRLMEVKVFRKGLRTEKRGIPRQDLQGMGYAGLTAKP